MMAEEIFCLCGELLRGQAKFCVHCGREMRQNCPICFDERRLLAVSSPQASPWCDNRGELLVACTSCGRWFPADVERCPDPSCAHPVAATWPIATLSAPDGAGYAGVWHWPSTWDRLNPLYREPRRDEWSSEVPVHAAFVAHGRLYVWAETRLLMPTGEAGGPLAPAVSQNERSPWRRWLGQEGQPNMSLSLGNRVAIVGGSAILATANGFILAGLCPSRAADVMPFNIGTPLAQVANENWWVGWSVRQGQPSLWRARAAASGQNLAWQMVEDAPPDSQPRVNSPLTLQNGLACWIGKDGALWQLNCVEGKLQPIAPVLDGVQRLWRARDGIHVIRATSMGLRVGLSAQLPNTATREAVGGEGPLKDVCVSPTLIAVVGATITVLDSQNGEVTGPDNRYNGRWIDGAVADVGPNSPGAEPRLLMLTQEGEEGDLSALRPGSGGRDPIWHEAGVRPLGLLVAGESLYVVHERGVIRLRAER